jgi:hypothetical protein
VEFWVGMKVGILASHILLSQKPDHKEMQVIYQDMQVCGIFHIVPILNIFGAPLDHDPLSFGMNAFLKVWAIFISFLFFFLGRASKYPLFYYSDTCPFFLMPLGMDFLSLSLF